MTAVPDYTNAQAVALDDLSESVAKFVHALGVCQEAGLSPSEALVAIGIEVPTFARGTVDRMLAAHVPQEISGEDLQT